MTKLQSNKKIAKKQKKIKVEFYFNQKQGIYEFESDFSTDEEFPEEGTQFEVAKDDEEFLKLGSDLNKFTASFFENCLDFKCSPEDFKLVERKTRPYSG